MTSQNKAIHAAELRKQAEAIERVQGEASAEDPGTLSLEEIRLRLQELRVHQIELQMQNEELRRAQVEIEAAKARYFDLYDLAPIGYCTLNAKGLIKEANLAAAAMLGVTRGSLAGQPFSQYIFVKDKDDYYLLRNKLCETSEPQGGELRLLQAGGTYLWVWLEFSSAEKESDTSECRLVMTDITPIKKQTEALQANEARIRSITDSARDAIIMMDEKGRISYWNAAAEQLFGYTQRQAVHQDLHTLIAPHRYHSRFRHAFAGFQQTGQGTAINTVLEMEGRHKDGHELAIELSLSALRIQDGWHATGIIRDITERKRMEEERSRMQLQLVHAQKMEAIGTLAGGIAHDFNNILGAVIGYAEMAREDSPRGSLAVRYLDKVLEASDRARNLVRQILTFSRQENIEPVFLDPEVIVREAAALLRPSLPTTIAIRVETAPDIPPVLADSTQLHQIVINLGTNAFHAMEATGGTLRFSLTTVDWHQQTPPAESRPGLFVCLAVEDTGPGIPAVVRQRIFEPFFTTKEVGRGTGMGLATVHGIVQKCGGFITCESEPGHGATFRVFLPAMADGSTSALSQEDADQAAWTGKGHILFVDDEQILVEMGGSMLERLGYEVTTRTSSLEALATFQNDPHRFDAVITDQTMPGMTGLDLARRMLDIRPDLPVILCTGYSKLVDEAQAKAWGIRGFAMKPLTRKEIVGLLREVMEGGG